LCWFEVFEDGGGRESAYQDMVSEVKVQTSLLLDRLVEHGEEGIFLQCRMPEVPADSQQTWEGSRPCRGCPEKAPWVVVHG
jgi:hypothetical protein